MKYKADQFLMDELNQVELQRFVPVSDGELFLMRMIEGQCGGCGTLDRLAEIRDNSWYSDGIPLILCQSCSRNVTRTIDKFTGPGFGKRAIFRVLKFLSYSGSSTNH